VKSTSAVLYCHIFSVWLYRIILHYFVKDMISEKILIIKCFLIFPTTFAWKTSHSKNKSARFYDKHTYVFMKSTHYSFHILMNLELSLQILEKFSNYKISWKPSNESWVFPFGPTDRHGEASSRFSNYENEPNNAPIYYTFLTVTGACPTRRSLLIKYLKPSGYSLYRHHHFWQHKYYVLSTNCI